MNGGRAVVPYSRGRRSGVRRVDEDSGSRWVWSLWVGAEKEEKERVYVAYARTVARTKRMMTVCRRRRAGINEFIVLK